MSVHTDSYMTLPVHVNMDRRATDKSPGTEKDETHQPGSRDAGRLFLLKRKCRSEPADAGLVYPEAS